MQPWRDLEVTSAALCAYREARNQGRDGIRAVIHVIANRAKAWHKSWAEIVYQPLQFSSMTYPKDPQLSKVPVQPDSNFVNCYEIADLIYSGGDFDLTDGATHYRNPQTATSQSFQEAVDKGQIKETVTIGAHVFYRERR